MTTRASVLAALAGLGALVTIAINYANSRTRAATLRATVSSYGATEADRAEQRVTELYTAASEQLGSEKAPVRLAGLYALARLAQSNPDQRQTIVNVWCAYLRMPYSPLPETDDGAAASQEAAGQAREEREVRLAAQRLLATHLRRGDDPDQPLGTYWPEVVELDLTGAHLQDPDLTGCRLPLKTTFRKASFGGDATFNHASFAGDAWFDGASFAGDARFVGVSFAGRASFRGVSFAGHGASVGGNASFSVANFADLAWFDRANFAGEAWFDGANFAREAWFHSASFRGLAWFDRASFAGRAWFGDANFVGNARFDRVSFAGNATFGNVSFARDAWFVGASFAGEAWFRGARFARGATFAPPPADPIVIAGVALAPRAASFRPQLDRAKAHKGDHVWPQGWMLSEEVDEDGYHQLVQVTEGSDR